MKNLILALVFTVALTFGINSIKASEISSNSVNIENLAGTNYEIKVYEDGAIWVYVYSEDGVFISKHIENQQ